MLRKHHNPVPDEELIFDFSSCQGTAEEAVMAMVAVEKVFRIYSDPKATEQDRVTVDSKIDGFLKTYFRQYKDYFRNPIINEKIPEYIQFSFLKEDEQYDDLTILAIRKK